MPGETKQVNYVISDDMRLKIIRFLEATSEFMNELPDWGDIWTAFKDGQGDCPVDLNLWCSSCKRISDRIVEKVEAQRKLIQGRKT